MNRLFRIEDLLVISNEEKVIDLLKCNDDLINHGILLNQDQALMLVKRNNQVLMDYKRIEIDNIFLTKIVTSFGNSLYIDKKYFANTIADIIDLFYYLKNDNEDIDDETIINFLFESFDGVCKGSIDLLIKEVYKYKEELNGR